MERSLTRKLISVKKSLDIFCYNARSILGDERWQLFSLFCDKNNFDVLLIREIWLHKILNSEIQLPNYTLYRNERKVNHFTGHSSHGGVLIAVRNDICSIAEPTKMEGVVACVVKLPDEKPDLLLVCVYNPPDDSLYRFTKDELVAVVEYLNERSNAYHIFCYGDFNLKEIDWDTMDSDDEQQKLFVEKYSRTTCNNMLLSLLEELVFSTC